LNFVFYDFPLFRVFLLNPVTKIAQHFGGPAFADANIDCAVIKPGFRGRQAGHRRQKSDFSLHGRGRNRHPLTAIETQRAAVKRFRIGVIKLQTANPTFIFVRSLNDDVDADIVGALRAVNLSRISGVKSMPQQIGMRNRNGNQIAAVDRDALFLLMGGAARTFFMPALNADIPKRQRLHGRGLARVVRPDEYHRVAEFNFGLTEAFKVADGNFSQHGINSE